MWNNSKVWQSLYVKGSRERNLLYAWVWRMKKGTAFLAFRPWYAYSAVPSFFYFLIQDPLYLSYNILLNSLLFLFVLILFCFSFVTHYVSIFISVWSILSFQSIISYRPIHAVSHSCSHSFILELNCFFSLHFCRSIFTRERNKKMSTFPIFPLDPFYL